MAVKHKQTTFPIILGYFQIDAIVALWRQNQILPVQQMTIAPACLHLYEALIS